MEVAYRFVGVQFRTEPFDIMMNTQCRDEARLRHKSAGGQWSDTTSHGDPWDLPQPASLVAFAGTCYVSSPITD